MALNELFTDITNSHVDVEALIENSTDNEATFKHLMWHIPTGMIYTLNKEKLANITEFVNTIAEQLNIDKDKVFNEDKIITDIEKASLNSSIEIEI